MVATLFRIFRHTLRFPLRSGLSLLMAIACTSLVLVLPAVTMQFVELTLVTLAPLPFIAMLTTWWSRHSEPKWRESSEASSALNAVLHDNLSGILQIKAYTVEPKALEDFDRASQKVGEKRLSVMKGQAIVWPAVSLMAESGIILMVAFGAAWTLQGKITEGTTLAFLVAWGFLFEPISRLSGLAQTFTRGVVSAERVFKILDTLEETHLTEGTRPPVMCGHIRLENVSLSYGEEAPAVSDLTLEAMPGQTVALVGATGAGKSTVLNLLTRSYEPNISQKWCLRTAL